MRGSTGERAPRNPDRFQSPYYLTNNATITNICYLNCYKISYLIISFSQHPKSKSLSPNKKNSLSPIKKISITKKKSPLQQFLTHQRQFGRLRPTGAYYPTQFRGKIQQKSYLNSLLLELGKALGGSVRGTKGPYSVQLVETRAHPRDWVHQQPSHRPLNH